MNNLFIQNSSNTGNTHYSILILIIVNYQYSLIFKISKENAYAIFGNFGFNKFVVFRIQYNFSIHTRYFILSTSKQNP